MHPLSCLSATLLASLALSTLSAAPQSAAPQLPPTAQSRPISVATLKSVTRTLSSDAFEGRAPTTAAEQKTVAYIIDQMKRAGLKPGNRGQWTQPVPLVELTQSNISPLTVTGGKKPLSFAYKTDMVAGSYRVEPHTALTDSEMVFVGFGINAPEKGWNDYAGVDVRGKTVVMLVNDPDYDMQGLDGPFDGRAMTYYGRWTYKFEEAARQGAAAALIIHDTYPAAYPWSVVVSSWTGPQLELDAPDGHRDQTQVNGWITGPSARALFDAAGKPMDKLIAAAKQPGFKAVPLGVKASLSFDSAIRRQASQNVIGILPGKSAPDEHVLYTAHWDHLGRCEPVDGDDICNGAVDNASGMAGLIALARTHARAGPARRSIVFLAVTAEESGLLGSRHYAENPVFPLGTTAGGVNMDGLNIHGRTRDVTLVGGGKSDLEAWLVRAATAQGRAVKPEPTPEKGSYYRSDHFSFARLGVPMVYAESGDDLVKGGVTSGRAAADDYTANRYHKPADEYDPAWDWSGALQDLDINYRVGRELANSTLWPNWYPTAEFRAIRDRSRAKP
ncbi:M28 family metallopeptidase [Sphingobium sufflavum]|uniref:M28 family metallopeptidase n=1 Tax=Sphingobium sufflavum TaxID=1129547 RepID=UPI001F204881|nr:M28 family metallopeptidase [Sphingobium sufflavum]MCE7796828.1 M28 family metallopeptidase [Sphingobium sufflavum]